MVCTCHRRSQNLKFRTWIWHFRTRKTGDFNLMQFCFDISKYINTLRYRDSILTIQLIHPGFILYAIYSFIIQSIVFIYRAYIKYSMMCIYSVQMYHLHFFACGFLWIQWWFTFMILIHVTNTCIHTYKLKYIIFTSIASLGSHTQFASCLFIIIAMSGFIE